MTAVVSGDVSPITVLTVAPDQITIVSVGQAAIGSVSQEPIQSISSVSQTTFTAISVDPATPAVSASASVSGGAAALNALNYWGQALSITDKSTALIYKIPSSAAGYQITGFSCHGTGDGYFCVQVNSFTVLSGRIRSTSPVLNLTMPNALSVPTASIVTLQVTNECGSTADYESTIFGAL